MSVFVHALVPIQGAVGCHHLIGQLGGQVKHTDQLGMQRRADERGKVAPGVGDAVDG